jgi:hypothetical protein
MPDYSGPLKLGQCPALFKSEFSMAAAAMIADIALTRSPGPGLKGARLNRLENRTNLVTTGFSDKR